MISAPEVASALPRALSSYPDPSGVPLYQGLVERVRLEPFNAIATAIFALAILHTFAAIRFARRAHKVQHAHDERARRAGRRSTPSVWAEALHFLGEIEVVFGLWAVVATPESAGSCCPLQASRPSTWFWWHSDWRSGRPMGRRNGSRPTAR